ncbi:MAG: sulfotransferase domain-containing protein [Bacteroidota bacterium]
MHRKPNFFIVGAAKCGTTSLYHHLKSHPDIYLCETYKEPYFFSSKYVKLPHKGKGDEVNDKRRKNYTTLDDYLKLFKGATNEKIIGEATTDYLYFYQAAKDIKNMNPHAKILISLRNPVERAYSAYYHQVNKKLETLSFKQALVQEENRIKDNYSYIWRYKQVGLYYKQVKYYLDVFGKENVKIILFDDIKNDIKSVIQDILQFLEVDTNLKIRTSEKHRATGVYRFKKFNDLLFKQSFIRRILQMVLTQKARNRLLLKLINLNLKKPEMDPSTRKYLVDYFREDIHKTEKLINRNLEHWLK